MKHISPGISTPIISSPTTASLVISSPLEVSSSITLSGSLVITGSILPSGSLLIDGDVNITGDTTFTKPPIFLDNNISVTSSWAENAITASYINPTFISASAAASGFGSGGGSSTYINTIGLRVYTDDTYITPGLKAYNHIAYNSNIIKARTIANTNGYIDINVKRNGTTLGTISLSNQSSSLDTTLTGWTTSLSTNDLLEFYVSQSSTYITDISIFIDIQSI